MLPVGGAVTALWLLGARTHAASLPAGRQPFVQQSRLEAVEVPHQRHHGADDDDRKPHHPQHSPAAAVGHGAGAGVQQREVVGGLGRQGRCGGRAGQDGGAV